MTQGVRNIKIVIVQLCIVGVISAIWEVAGRISQAVFFVLGTPLAIIQELWSLIVEGRFHEDFLITGAEALSGLVIGTAVGSCVGLGLWYSQFAASVARPFIFGLGAMPIFAFAPLLIIWFGVGFEMKVALSGLSTVFVAFSQSFRGAGLVDIGFVEVLQGMGANNAQIFRKAVVPASLEWVFSSVRLNVGFSLLGAFIGEFIASNRGLGYVILRASSLYNVPRALAASVGILLLAGIFEGIARLAESRRHEIIQLLSVPPVLWGR